MSIKTLNAILELRYELKCHGKCCHNYILPPKLLDDDKGKSEKYKTQGDTHASASDIAYELHVEDIQ